MAEAPDWVTLTEDEEVVWSSPPSLVPYTMGIAVPALIALAGLGVILVGTGLLFASNSLVGSVPSGALLAGGGLLLVFGLLGSVFEYVAWYSHRYLVTTDEVYHKQGLVSRSVTNIRIDRIENTTFNQSTLGRLLSYGDVRIATAGTEGVEMVFRKVDDPDAVVEKITRLLDEA